MIELVLVVGIIGILTAMVVGKITQQKTRMNIDQAAVDLMIRLNKARALATAAGSRSGTPRLQNCGSAGDNRVTVRVDLGNDAYTVPESIELDPTTDVMVTRCATYRMVDLITAPVDLRAAAFAPNRAVAFSFLPSGRVVAADRDELLGLHFEIRGVENPADHYGLRVLPSGVVCSAQDPAAVACDEAPR